MAFTCPRCGRTSHHPKDEEHGYCGACHDWTGDELEEPPMSNRRRKLNLTGNQPSGLGELELAKGVFVLKAHHGWVEPNTLFDKQDEPLFAVQFEGFDKDGENAGCQVLLRPGVVGQLISALIVVAATKNLMEQVADVVSDELRQITLGRISFDIKNLDVREN